jgi:hypothetical protein
MKIKKYISVFILVLVLLSCKEEKVQLTQVCVLIDVTDEKFRDDNFVADNLPKYLRLMKLDAESGGYSGGEIKLSLINEVSDSKSKTVKIAAAETGMLGENPLTRRDEVQRFNNNLKESFTAVLNEADWGTNASKIYQKVTRELLKMKRKEADRNYLIIYSDMLENSNLFSFYGQNWRQKIERLAEDPGTTLEQLAEKGPAMPDLSEFDIFIVASRDSENDEKINLSEKLWTSLFEYQGATVSFNANLEL